MLFPLRDETRISRPSVITGGLILACAAVFLWQQSLGERAAVEALHSFGMIPAVVLGGKNLPPWLAVIPPWLTPLSSLFLHGTWGHLLGNMLYLWVFGRAIEAAVGRWKFLLFYALCGVVAALAHGQENPHSPIPMIGASGAISGVLGAYLLLYPRARILMVLWLVVFFKTFRISALVVLGGWFLWQVYNYTTANPLDPGIAWMAHLGGFVAGAVLILIFKKDHIPLFRRRPGPWG